MKLKKFIIPFSCILLSLLFGIITHDLWLGGSILASGLLCAYYSSIGKRCNYLLGFINYLLMGYVAFQNHLYGIFIFYLFVFLPLQVRGFFTWKKHLNEQDSVCVREFTVRNSIVITISCILGSLLIGYFLSLIPGQQLAFMDASSNIINLCGVILMILRFKESWWLWLINNIIDLAIWLIVVFQNGFGSVMMLLTSIGYLLINIYGVIKWSKETKKKTSD